jgi:alkylation response protein AidB-like acyl-CoA dehydrogenase
VTEQDRAARLRTLAEAAREQLRRAAAAGDRAARQALTDLGEPVPVLRHWADLGDRDADD